MKYLLFYFLNTKLFLRRKYRPYSRIIQSFFKNYLNKKIKNDGKVLSLAVVECVFLSKTVFILRGGNLEFHHLRFFRITI